MKTKYLKLIGLILLGMFGSLMYANYTDQEVKHEGIHIPSIYENIRPIPISDAKDGVRRFGEVVRDSLTISMAKKRRMPMAWALDLQELQAFHGTRYVRAYIAYKEVEAISKLPSYPANSSSYRIGEEALQLVLVSVQEDGKDDTNKTASNLILPCPNLCDFDSPFLEAYEEGLGESVEH